MEEINFEEIKKIVDSFPQLPKRERSMIEIIGLRDKENVNSNYLAYYFDEKETHGFGRLFFNALLKVMKIDFNEKIYQEEFIVKKEENAKDENGKGRIDILIRCIYDSWAIIIENKIHSGINNPLQTYISSLKSGEIRGVLLTLWTLNERHNNFVNITHDEFIIQVKKDLKEIDKDNIKPKELYFLEDFINNVKSFYYFKENQSKMQEQLKLYHSNQDTFSKMGKIEKEASEFVKNTFNNIFKNIKFLKRKGARNNKSYQHFYSESYKGFRFFYDINRMTKNNELRLAFELYGKYRTEIDKITNDMSFKSKVEELGITQYLNEYKTQEVSHILWFKISEFLKEGEGFKVKLEEIVSKINEIIPICNEILNPKIDNLK